MDRTHRSGDHPQPDYAERFKKDMVFTRNIVDLWDGGISVFSGHYKYRCLDWVTVRDADPYDESFTDMWQANFRSIAVLRFFDDKNMAHDKEISEHVRYGLSESDWNLFDRVEGNDIRVDGSTNQISADNQIRPGAFDGLIPF